VLRQGIEATLFEGLAASVGLILIRTPATRLLFQHGQISAHDADLIASSVLYYSAAIWAFSLQQILNRAFYALHDTTTPLVMSMLTLAVNLVVEVPLVWHLGEAGMAVGTLVSFAAQAIIMLYMLDRRLGGMDLSKVRTPFIKMLCATALMTAVCLGVMHSPIYPKGNHRSDWAMQLVMLMALGSLTYVGACAAMGLDTLTHILPKRLRRA
jgi:putative peptidoglycan lipid II flippase